VLDPLFAEQDELLREAERMGYEAVVPASPPAEPASAPLAADDAGQMQQVEVKGEDVALFDLQHAEPAWQAQFAAKPPAWRAECKTPRPGHSRQTGGSATKPAPMPAVATSPQAEVQPAARPEMPGGSAMQTGYDDLPLWMPMKRGPVTTKSI
jgi:DNA polymerase-3 subunit gamma/tau